MRSHQTSQEVRKREPPNEARSRESEKPRIPSPKSASRLHRASKNAQNRRKSSSRKVAQAQSKKRTARKLPLWSRKGCARISRKVSNFQSVLLEVLNTAHLELYANLVCIVLGSGRTLRGPFLLVRGLYVLINSAHADFCANPA